MSVYVGVKGQSISKKSEKVHVLILYRVSQRLYMRGLWSSQKVSEQQQRSDVSESYQV